MKTDIKENVGKHAFEVAGLGLAPFLFVGASENVITYPDGTQQAGGSCDYCGTGIRLECHVKSADGKAFKVGCNCISKVGDTGLLKAYKNSAEFRAIQRKNKAAKNAIIFKELKALIATLAPKLAATPHPRGFTDRQTGAPLTALDNIQWLFDHSGATGRASLLKHLKGIAQ